MLFTPFTFPNGQSAKNRIFKSAMEEQLARHNAPTDSLVRLYDVWAKGGAGVLVTGNVMVSAKGKGSICDVVLTDESSMPALQDLGKSRHTRRHATYHANQSCRQAVAQGTLAHTCRPKCCTAKGHGEHDKSAKRA